MPLKRLITHDIFQDVEELYVNDDHFMIIGYSFGSVVALKLAHVLESKGRIGKVMLIDGSPEMMMSIASYLIPTKCTVDDLQGMLVMLLIDIAYPEKKNEVLARVLLEDGTFKRYIKFLEITNESQIYSPAFIHRTFTSTVNRMKILQNLGRSERVVKAFNATSVSLIKPSIATVQHLNEFYGLRAFTSSNIQVYTVEGNHSSMLENPKLLEILINS